MKAIILIILSVTLITFVVKHSNKRLKYKKDCELIDSHSKCIPLIQPIMVFKFTKEECDSIRVERQKELDKIVHRAKYHSKKPLETYFAWINLLENDVRLDVYR